MKRLIIAALVSLFLVGVTGTAKAVVLAPGGFDSPTGVEPDWGAFITSISVPIAYDSILGEVYQEVHLNGTGYLFGYQFENFESPDSLNAIWRMTAANFAGFYTDVDAFTEDGEIMPIWLDRSFVGDSIGFQFLTFGPEGPIGGVNPGDISAILWIQTDAKFYGLGSAHFINGGTEDVVLYGPVIPEPATMSLLGFGVLGLFGLRRKKV